MAAVTFAVADTPGASIPLAGGTNGYRMVFKTLTCDGGDGTAGGNSLGGSTDAERLAAWATALGLSSITLLRAEAIAAGHFHTFNYTTGKLQSWKSTGSAGAFAEMTGAMSHAIKITAIGAP